NAHIASLSAVAISTLIDQGIRRHSRWHDARDSDDFPTKTACLVSAASDFKANAKPRPSFDVIVLLSPSTRERLPDSDPAPPSLRRPGTSGRTRGGLIRNRRSSLHMPELPPLDTVPLG